MYYVIKFSNGYTENFCLWFSDKNGKDQFLTNDLGVICFSRYSELFYYITENNLNIEQNQINYDVSMAINWLAECSSNIDCEYFLTLWNITTDLVYSIKRDFLGNSESKMTKSVYDKLYWGNNLPALKGNEDIYIPKWKSKELHRLHLVIADSVSIINDIFF